LRTCRLGSARPLRPSCPGGVGGADKTYEEWREDLLAQVAAGWVLASVFVRFCEDNGLVATPLLSGPGAALDRARDHRAEFFAANHRR
jgi:hypothetical protein